MSGTLQPPPTSILIAYTIYRGLSWPFRQVAKCVRPNRNTGADIHDRENCPELGYDSESSSYSL